MTQVDLRIVDYILVLVFSGENDRWSAEGEFCLYNSVKSRDLTLRLKVVFC